MPHNPLPGVSTGKTATPRKLLITDQARLFVPGGVIIDGSKSRDPLNTNDLDVLRAGMVMGKITTGGKYAPAILGLLAVAHTSSGTTVTALTVPVATAVEIVRRIGATGTFNLIGPPAAAGTVATELVTYSAVNQTTGVITITDITVNKAIDTIIAPTDGSEIPVAMVGDDRDTTGILVTDHNQASVDVQWPQPTIGGFLDVSQIINWPTDASVRSWIISQLNGGDGVLRGNAPFQSDDTY